jgi:hypothetical protein
VEILGGSISKREETRRTQSHEALSEVSKNRSNSDQSIPSPPDPPRGESRSKVESGSRRFFDAVGGDEGELPGDRRYVARYCLLSHQDNTSKGPMDAKPLVSANNIKCGSGVRS